jgi:multidrug transporter EmrE-like cation transporter
MWAWAVFTSGNIILRVLSSHFLVGETLTWKVGLGVILVLAGGQFVREGIGASN